MNFLSLYKIEALLTDFKWWTLLFFLLGFIHITNPPLEDHMWRQTFTLMVAKNFNEIEGNIFYPRTDLCEETDGIIAAEFPLYNYLIALSYRIFGYHIWLGRLINWVISCLGLWFFYKVTRKLFNKDVALFAGLSYMVSITFVFARKIMPDTFALSLVIIGTWYCIRYLENVRIIDLLVGFLFFTAGILSKIPSICFAGLLIIPVLDRYNPLKAKIWLVALLSAGGFMMLWWYFIWMPYLLETYGNQLIWPVSLREGWDIFREQINWVYYRFYKAFPSYIFFVLASVGILFMILIKSNPYRIAILGYIFLFFLFILKTGIVFPTHNYYIIPFTPLMALGVGYIAGNIPLKPMVILPFMLLFIVPAWLHNFQLSKTEEKYAYLLELEELSDRYIPKESKIMVNYGQFDPTMMFYTGRRGWTVNNDILEKYDWMPDYKKLGVSYLVVDRSKYDEPLPYEILYKGEHFIIYKP